jgi:hypothetical protein
LLDLLSLTSEGDPLTEEAEILTSVKLLDTARRTTGIWRTSGIEEPAEIVRGIVLSCGLGTISVRSSFLVNVLHRFHFAESMTSSREWHYLPWS